MIKTLSPGLGSPSPLASYSRVQLLFVDNVAARENVETSSVVLSSLPSSSSDIDPTLVGSNGVTPINPSVINSTSGNV